MAGLPKNRKAIARDCPPLIQIEGLSANILQGVISRFNLLEPRFELGTPRAPPSLPKGMTNPPRQKTCPRNCPQSRVIRYLRDQIHVLLFDFVGRDAEI